MSAAAMKQVLIELTRKGCRVETLLYDPPAVTFRTPQGARCALTTERDTFRLARGLDQLGDEQVGRFSTLNEALRAATAA